MRDWNGILKIVEIQHIDVDGTVLWEQKNLLNLLHLDGEEFLLRAAFTGGQDSTIIPENYYIGLDNRTTVEADQTVDDLSGEPTAGGYERQEVSSSGDFSVDFLDDHFQITSPILVFRSTSASWGPVANLFLTTADDDSGYLISTIVLESSISLTPGQNVSIRLAMSFRAC